MKNKIIGYLNRAQAFRKIRWGIVAVLTLVLFAYNFGSGAVRLFGANISEEPVGASETVSGSDNATYEINTIYIKSSSLGMRVDSYTKWESDVFSAPFNRGDSFEVMAIMRASDLVLYQPDENGVAWPNTNISGLQSDDITIDYQNPIELKKLEGEKTVVYWEFNATCHVFRAGSDFKIMLMKNDGSAAFTSPGIEVKAIDAVQEDLFVNTSYGLVEKNTATNMLNGEWKKDNSQNNYYPLYVGETLEVVTQENTDGQSWTLKKDNDPETEMPATTSNGRLAASYFATTPGKYTITLKNSSSIELSTFYFEVKYPIFVETELGTVHKDRVHEYVFTALDYSAAPDVYITDDKRNPLYVRNAGKDPGKYLMYTGDTVVLSAYYAASESQNFNSTSNNLTIGDASTENITINGTAFKKVTAEFIAGAQGDAKVTIGDEMFYIYVRGADHTATANHFDIEIADRGTDSGEIITRRADGSIETVTLVYNAFVSGVNKCTVYDGQGNEIGHLDSDEYWERGNPGEPQYELTSAYWTNGKVLTDEKNNPLPEGQWSVRSRDIKGAAVEKVVFDIELLLKPLNTRDNADITVLSAISEMNQRQILDALNKCPNHSGLDFTIQSDFTFASVEPMAKKILKDADLTEGRFSFGLYDAKDTLISKVSNQKDGNIYFDALYFSNNDASRKFVYYLKEINDNQKNIEYDTNIFKMTVSFTTDPATNVNIPVVNYEYSSDNGTSWKSIAGTVPEFVNTVIESPATPTPTAPPTTSPTASPKDKEVTVDVVWEDDGKNRPDSVVVQLLKDGEVYDETTLSESNGWHHTWSSLDGSAEWSVREVNVPNGYTVTYRQDGLHFTVINTAALLQTGQLNWPIPVLGGFGLILIVLGSVLESAGRKKQPNEN